ncbi:MAG: hypothetical protein NVSMB55_09290 [Mycobacteriales bacterium]
MLGMPRRSRGLLAAALAISLSAALPAFAHSYRDPALTTVFDGVSPTPLPSAVVVDVRPSVVDELVVSNSTATALEVLAVGGEPFLRVSADGVEANLASPDWYATGTPDGGPVPPPDVVRDRGRGTPRWVRVSRQSAWSEFDPRLRPPVETTPEIRAAGRELILASWQIPLRYGDVRTFATGHIAFRPVRGGLLVGVTKSAVAATALQGELPGLFVNAPADSDIGVQGKDGLPFLRFNHGEVLANTASASWRDDQRARGREVSAADGWVKVATGRSYSWLDSRLRYPRDLPPRDLLDRRSVVERWTVPVSIDARAAAIEGTITWVPRSVALGQLGRVRTGGQRAWWTWSAPASVAALALLVVAVLVRRRKRRA